MNDDWKDGSANDESRHALCGLCGHERWNHNRNGLEDDECACCECKGFEEPEDGDPGWWVGR
jgi:hypothetical protein